MESRGERVCCACCVCAQNNEAVCAHLAGDVGVEGVPVLGVQLLGVVVGGLLGAHVVDGAARERRGVRACACL